MTDGTVAARQVFRFSLTSSDVTVIPILDSHIITSGMDFELFGEATNHELPCLVRCTF